MADDETDMQGIPAPEGHADLIETDYEIGQDNIVAKVGPFGLDIHNPVFFISGLAVTDELMHDSYTQKNSNPENRVVYDQWMGTMSWTKDMHYGGKCRWGNATDPYGDSHAENMTDDCDRRCVFQKYDTSIWHWIVWIFFLNSLARWEQVVTVSGQRF